MDNCNRITTLMASTASKERHSSIGQEVILILWVGNMFQELGVSNVQTAL